MLSRADVERLLAPEDCIAAIEDAFRRLAEGSVPPPALLSMHAKEGSFHAKAGLLEGDRPYFAAKLNANFPENGARHGLPTIQGAVVLFDASNGTPLALMDSMAITALRTAAASAVAAKYLANQHCESLLVCGCGGQALAQVRALVRVRRLESIRVYDLDAARARGFAEKLGKEVKGSVQAVSDLHASAKASDIIVTCTTARRYFLARDMVREGTFIAAVGADHEDKQEIDPQLLAHSKVVTDLTDQARAIGDLHHAIAAGVMAAQDVHAELGEVVAGKKPGRQTEDEITVFDSTGTGLQDVAAAIAVYRRAAGERAGQRFNFA